MTLHPPFVPALRALLFLVGLFWVSTPLFGQVATLQLQAQLPNDATYKLLDRVPWAFSVNPRGGVNYPGGGTWIVYVTGQDIYRNVVYIPVARGLVPPIADGRNYELANQFWTVPNDGTLFNVEAGYTINVAIYDAAPTALPGLLAPGLSAPGRFKIDVIANLAVPSPGVIYPGSNQKQFYRGGDIAQFQAYWLNNARGESTGNGRVQSRPLRARDRYSVDLRLTSNPALNIAALPGEETPSTTVPEEDDQLPQVTDSINDDFKLMRIFLAADLGPARSPDGFSQIRRIEVTGTPLGTSAFNPLTPNNGALNPYGLNGVTGTVRTYDPQPYDGFLDIGEQVSVVTEQLMPRNFVGSFFVALRVAMTNPALDSASGNNVFVSNAANKIQLVEASSPAVSPASAVQTDNGAFVRGGSAASDYGGLSEDGEIVVFASRARDLLIPPPVVEQIAAVLGPNFTIDQLLANSSAAGLAAPYLTGGQQLIFLQYQTTREILLASRTAAGVSANADCFNPSISADGRYIAFDSRANNLVPSAQTGGRSHIYVYDPARQLTVLVSRNATGALGNGDSFNPVISQSGRFVAFESMARNLDVNFPVPANSTSKQIFVHDRDVQGTGVFDVVGNTATYIVSVTASGGKKVLLDTWNKTPAINLEDSTFQMQANGGLFVAFTSYAGNAPNSNGGYAMVYRATIDATNADPALRGAVPAKLTAVSLNPDGSVPVAIGYDPMGSFVRPDCDEAAINGDGSIIAFTSGATSFVINNSPSPGGGGGYTPTYPNNAPLDPSAPPAPGVIPGGDYNRVPDVFVRDLNGETPGSPKIVRVSVSDERVATGVISFVSGPGLGNVPNSQPLAGDTISISDGTTQKNFVFGTNVNIGANVQATRDNLITAINIEFGGTILAEPTTPPNTLDANGLPAPGLGYNASIYLKNVTPGERGNVPITVVLATVAPPATRTSSIVANGMRGGGRQAADDALLPGEPLLPPILGVPFGSGQPSLDRSGKLVAFRTIATNMDVYRETPESVVPALPPFPGYPRKQIALYPAQEKTLITGEHVRPLIFPTANVYLHNRNVDGRVDTQGKPIMDAADNMRTARVSVSTFGYPTLIFGTQPSGINANTSAANHTPALSANGRYVAFSSDSTLEGGLIFRENNLTWPQYANVRNVFVADSRVTGDFPPTTSRRPVASIISPLAGTQEVPGTAIAVEVRAQALDGKRVRSVQISVNDGQTATLTAEPFTWAFTPGNPGIYRITAVATDSGGVTGVSQTVEIKVGEFFGSAPLVQVTRPAAGFVIEDSQLYLNATATDTDGGVSAVRFFVNNVEINPGGPPPGKVGNVYGAYWQVPAPNAEYRVHAVASDVLGNWPNRASVTSVTLNSSPERNPLPFVSDVNVTRAKPGDPLQLSASAVFPTGGDTGRAVDFYANGVRIGAGTLSASSQRYELTWTPPEGTVTLGFSAMASARNVPADPPFLGSRVSEAPCPPGKPLVASEVWLADQGLQNTYTLKATGAPVSYFEFRLKSGGSLPLWLVANPVTGTMTGIPPSPTDLEIEVIARTLCNIPGDPATITLRTRPIITSPSTWDVIVGQTLGNTPYQLSAVGATGSGAFTYAVVPPPQLPTWASLVGSQLVVTQPPTRLDTPIVLTLTATRAGVVGSPFQLTVRTPVPVITGPVNLVAAPAKTTTVQMLATGAPTSWNKISGPSWLTINATTGVVTAQPSAAGVFRGVFTASNAFGASAEFVLTVTAAYVPSDPNPDFSTGTGPDRTVYAVTSDAAGRIYIGGEFTSYNGANAPALARLLPSGALDSGFAAAGRPNGTVRALSLQTDGNLIVGGDFTSVGSAPAGRLVRLLSTGAVDPSFNVGSGANAPVRAVLVQTDGRIVVAGDFTSFNGQAVNYLVRLNANGSIDGTFRTGPAPFGPNFPVYALAAAGDGKIYIGGWFGGVDGQPASRIARLLANGHLDVTFSSQAGVGQGTDASNQDPYRPGTLTSGSVNALLVTANGRLIVGGDFNTAAGRPAYRLAAFASNGSIIRDFGNLLPANGAVTALLAQSTDQIIVAGTFSFLGGQPSAGLARIDANGVIDQTFVAPVLAGQVTLGLQALAGQADGSLFIAGNFPGLAGATQVRIGKLYGTPGLEPVIAASGPLSAGQGSDFSYNVALQGGQSPESATYAVTAGALPSGLVLNSANGRISGRPTAVGAFNFTVTATRGTYSSATAFSLIVQSAVAPFDFTGDNKNDLLWQRISDGRVHVWGMNGLTRVSGVDVGLVPDTGWRVMGSGDFTGDGKVDILWRHLGDGRVHVWEMNGTAAVRGHNLPTVADKQWQIGGVGDMTGDGKVDIVWQHRGDGRVLVWAMNGLVGSGVVALPTVGDLWWQVASVGDMSGDGKADIVWQHRRDGRVLVWEMNGTTPVRGVDLPKVADLAWRIGMVGDMTGDGRNDLVWRHDVDGRVLVWEMDGTVLKSVAGLPTVADTAWQIGGTSEDRYEVRGDFTGNGWADILWQHRGNGQVHVWEMEATKPVTGMDVSRVGDLDWRIGGTGDMTGDGKVDIVWRNTKSGAVHVWAMNGAKVAAGIDLPIVADQSWQIGAVGDLTADGWEDILWRNTANGAVHVWSMEGTKQKAGINLPTVADQSWQIAATGDMNGDGWVDIVWRNTATGAVHVWSMEGTKQKAGINLPTVADQNWQIGGTADYTGDGWLDILWRNTATGAVHVWQMEGTTAKAGLNLPPVTDANWRIFNK